MTSIVGYQFSRERDLTEKVLSGTITSLSLGATIAKTESLSF